jgi:hydrogenase large subunit
MGKRIVVDPVTRIEGHLRIDVEVEQGSVKNAWSSGQMWRGIENILLDRDPREAWFFTQRICGVCTTVHAIASVRAVENALGVQVPLNAQLVRNLLIAGHGLHDHIVHFYHLSALDWVDVVSATKADPAKAAQLGQSLSPWHRNTKQELKAVQDKLASFVQRGQLGIFTNGYWGHPAMKLPPHVNLLAAAHYLQALEYQRKANQAVGILGGKTPNIQNLAVGGVTNTLDLDGDAALNREKLDWVKSLLTEVKQFVEQVYLVDVAAVGALYADWLGYGAGVTNYLATPDMPLDAAATKFDLPGGVIVDGDLAGMRTFDGWTDELFEKNVEESIARSWYDGDWQRSPYDEETVPQPPDPPPGLDQPVQSADGEPYSWVKAPRFEKLPMQVGPLAQMLVGYAAGHARVKHWVDHALKVAGSVAGTSLGPEVLHSTLGRHAARAVRATLLAEQALSHWEKLVANVESGDTNTFTPWEYPAGEIQGFGVHEAPRGILSHWVVIEAGKIKNYQCVVPSTWNAGPRDGEDQMGPYEASLVGNPIADDERPLEVLRTIHSFDPCLACAIHALDPEGRELARVRAL